MNDYYPRGYAEYFGEGPLIQPPQDPPAQSGGSAGGSAAKTAASMAAAGVLSGGLALPLIIGGGSLLGGLTGKWAEDQAMQEGKQEVARLSKWSVTGDRVGRDLDKTLSAMQPIRDLTAGVRTASANARMTSGARAGLSRPGEVRAARAGLEALASTMHRMDVVRGNIERARTAHAARAATHLAGAREQVSAGSAKYMADVSEFQRKQAEATGDQWRAAIAGLTQLASMAYGLSSMKPSASTKGYTLPDVGMQ